MLASVSPLLNDDVLYKCLATRSEFVKYKVSIGSTDLRKDGQYLEEEIIDTATSNLSTQNDNYDMISLDSSGNTDFLSEEELMD